MIETEDYINREFLKYDLTSRLTYLERLIKHFQDRGYNYDRFEFEFDELLHLYELNEEAMKKKAEKKKINAQNNHP